MIAGTAILSPDGTSTGPEAEFATTEVHVVGELTIIDWQDTLDDTTAAR